MASGIPSKVFPAPYDFGQMGALDRICKNPDKVQATDEACGELNSMPAYLQNEIYRHIWICAKRKDRGDPRFGENHAIGSLNRLAAAVRGYAVELYASLESSHQHVVEGRVYENAGRPETQDLVWGKTHATDHAGILLRSLSALRPNQDFGPFLVAPSFHSVVHYLDADDLGSLAEISRTFRDAISTNEQIWASFHEREGIPQVQGFPGELRNYRRDYLNMSGTYGRKIIEESLRIIMVGSIPKIRREVFACLYNQDPFQLERSIGKNYVFVVVPGLIQTKDDKVVQFALEQLRDLHYSSAKGRGSVIQDVIDNIFQDCARGSAKTSIFLMRRQIAYQTKGKLYFEQKETVERCQMQVTDLLTRTVFDAIQILRTGTCPDHWRDLVFVRCTDAVYIGGGDRIQSVIGGFVATLGIQICLYENKHLAVVPCIPAEVPPAIVLDDLVIDITPK